MAMKGIRINTRVTFFSPVRGERTATGGSRQGWSEEFKAWVGVVWLRGGEAVLNSRMQGRRPAVLIMRRRAAFSAIRGDWEVRFDGISYEVRELPKPQDNGPLLEMMVEAKP